MDVSLCSLFTWKACLAPLLGAGLNCLAPLLGAGMTFHVSFPGMGIKDLEVHRVAYTLKLFGKEFPIFWYGIIIASAFLLCMFLASKEAYRYGLASETILDVMVWIIPLSIVGARLYYVAFAWDDFRDDLSRIFSTRHGGLAFYGGVLAAVITFIIFARLHKIPLANLADFTIVYLPLGQAIGRWGNFMNQEAFGVNTKAPWGMISEGTTAYLQSFPNSLDPYAPVHPTFLYESLGNLLIFFLLLRLRKYSQKKWSVVAGYSFLYGLLRFYVEGLRTDALMIGNSNLRVSQVLSLVMILGGAGVLLYYNLNRASTRFDRVNLANPPKEAWVPLAELSLQGTEAPVASQDQSQAQSIEKPEVEPVGKAASQDEVEPSSKPKPKAERS